MRTKATAKIKRTGDFVQVVDAFVFFNELDILEIRLAELYDVVDLFILVEATHTHKGDPKPLYYAESRQRFARYFDKIRHIVVGDLPRGAGLPAIWRREMTQRQRIADGLHDVPDDAIVLISDLDEIPRREAVALLRRQGIPDGMVVTFEQRLHYYNVNTHCISLIWTGTRAARCIDVKAITPDGVRWAGLYSAGAGRTMGARSTEYPLFGKLEHAGWHLSYFGDVAHIQDKMGAFLHQELVNEETTDTNTIAGHIARGEDVWGRPDGPKFALGPAPDLPAAIRADPVRWSRYFHPDWRPIFNQDWYDPEQARYVGEMARAAPQGGELVEIGCWEGRSTAVIAPAVAPRALHCVDHWRGNEDEGDAESVGLAQERDVFGTFERNMSLLTLGNIEVWRGSWQEWVKVWDKPIAFLHLDASHDYDSVYNCLQAVKPLLVPGALLCGDDGYADGVYRAVRDVFGEGKVRDIGNRLWVTRWEGARDG